MNLDEADPCVSPKPNEYGSIGVGIERTAIVFDASLRPDVHARIDSRVGVRGQVLLLG